MEELLLVQFSKQIKKGYASKKFLEIKKLLQSQGSLQTWVAANTKDWMERKKPCHNANKKPCHNARNKLSQCKQKRSDADKKPRTVPMQTIKIGCKQNSFFATRLISFRREAIHCSGFCRPHVKWEDGSGKGNFA